jgi:glycosyltransferase involved in cell wall biosynthesis
VALDRTLGWALNTPARLREEWLGAVTYISFDRMCARRLPECDVFYGYSMASLRSMTVARRHGALTVVHAATSYVPRLRGVLEMECRRLGIDNEAVGTIVARRAVREYAEADLIRVQSTLVRDSLLDAGISAGKIALIPPAVDLEAFRPAVEREDQPDFVVCFVGAFSVRKGIHHLLKAWDLVADNGSRLVLHGGYGNRWGKSVLARAVARGDVMVRGGAPYATYAEADICVVPSIEDGFCYVVLEAMACGLPVIVTDQVGAKDIVCDGVEGFVVPAGEPVALADRIARLRADPELRQRMGEASRRRAELHTFVAEGRALSATLQAARASLDRAPVVAAG